MTRYKIDTRAPAFIFPAIHMEIAVVLAISIAMLAIMSGIVTLRPRDYEGPCAHARNETVIGANVMLSFPYADDPSLEGAEVRVLGAKPKESACEVRYEVAGKGTHSRLYEFDGDGEITRASLPFESKRWCEDVLCRGQVD